MTYPDPHDLPSPIWSFLRSAAWVPVTRPGQPGLFDLSRPGDAWFYRDASPEAQPLFAALVPHDLRVHLDGEGAAARRLRALGLRDWSDPENAGPRIRTITRLFAAGTSDSMVPSVRKAYERSWANLTSGAGLLPWTAGETVELLAVRGNQVSVVQIGASTEDDPVHVVVEGESRFTESMLGALGRRVLAVDRKDGAAVAGLLAPRVGRAVRVVRADDFQVLVDGVRAEPTLNRPLLLAAVGEWFSDFVALTLDIRAPALRRQTENTVREAVKALRGIRLVGGHTLSVELDGLAIDLPPFLPPALAIPGDGTSAIAFVGDAERVTWQALELLCHPIGVLIRQDWVAPELRGAVVTLSRELGGDLVAPPANEHFSRALGQDVSQITELRRNQRQYLDDLLYRLRPAVVLLIGPASGLALDGALDEQDAHAALERILSEEIKSNGLALDAAQLLAVAAAEKSLAGVRDALGLDFGAFNRVLSNLGAAYQPIHESEQHRSAFAAELIGRRSSMLDSIRAHELEHYAVAGVAPLLARAADQISRAIGAWKQREDIPVLIPDAAWLDDWATPPEKLIQQRLEQWLADIGVDPGASTGLEDVEVVKGANEAALAKLAREGSRTVAAWARKNGHPVPAWTAGEVGALVSQAGLDAALMVSRLAHSELVALLARRGLWPESMPLTLDPAELGLTERDLAVQDDAAKREKWERDRERRGVRFGDSTLTLTLDEDDREQFLSTLEATISRSFLASSTGTSTLLELKDSRRGGGGDKSDDDPPPPPPGGRGRVSEAKTEAIGFVGERVVFEWLKANYGVGPEAWVSRNRRFALSDGNEGSDDLGFDFRVPQRRGGDLMFEVKSSSGTGLAFEMSDKEIVVASENRTNRRYRVVFVANVLREERQLYVLPNPQSEDGRRCFRAASRGIGYAFKIGDLAPSRQGKSRSPGGASGPDREGG